MAKGGELEIEQVEAIHDKVVKMLRSYVKPIKSLKASGGEVTRHQERLLSS